MSDRQVDRMKVTGSWRSEGGIKVKEDSLGWLVTGADCLYDSEGVVTCFIISAWHVPQCLEHPGGTCNRQGFEFLAYSSYKIICGLVGGHGSSSR